MRAAERISRKDPEKSAIFCAEMCLRNLFSLQRLPAGPLTSRLGPVQRCQTAQFWGREFRGAKGASPRRWGSYRPLGAGPGNY